MSKRIVYLDVVKAFAIFLVIWGHIIQFLDSSKVDDGLRVFIYSFHMPLFMLMCGYFSESSFSKNFGEFLKKKFIQLIVPVIFWTIAIIIFLLIVYKSREEAIVEFIGGSWFLRTLFACYLYIYIVKKIKLNDWLLAILSSSVMFIVPRATFLQFNWMLLFFWSGYFMKKHDEFFSKYRMYITFVSLFIYIGIYSNIKNCGYALINIETLKTNALTILLKYFGSLCASIFMINIMFYVCKLIKKEAFKIKVAKVGNYTLGIYLVHSFLIARLFPLFLKIRISNMYFYNMVLTPSISFLILLACMIVIKYTSRNRILNFLMYGNQY